MSKLIVLFVVCCLSATTTARPASEDISDSLIIRAEAPGAKFEKIDPFGNLDGTFDPFLEHGFNSIPDPEKNSILKPEFSFERVVAQDFADDVRKFFRSNIILPKPFKSERSAPEYVDSSSSFDIYNELVYGPEFLTNNVPLMPGNPFGPAFPFAVDASLEAILAPVIDFAESLEDIDSYFGDNIQRPYDYFGGTDDSDGDAGEFGGSLASFFSRIYDGPVVPDY